MSTNSQVTATEIPSKYLYWAQSAFERAEKFRIVKASQLPVQFYWTRTADDYDRACWTMLFLHEFNKEHL